MTPTRSRASLSRTACLLLAATLVFGVSACGSDDKKDSASGGDGKSAQAVEKAFLTGMVHHHGTAIEMAEIAKKQGEDPFITNLAENIITTQKREKAELKTLYERLVGGELKPDPGAHDGLGLSAEEAGMTHNAQTNVKLRAAKPFDRAFVDEMVPHHEGAIKMANVVLKSTKDAGLRKLAEGIISTQEREVKEMNSFRSRKFGGPVPESAGHGADKSMNEEHGAGHSG